MTRQQIPDCPEQYESQWLGSSYLEGLIFQAESEARFLNGIIRATKPKKLLEVGVYNGGSSVVILNAIKDDPAAHLYSLDLQKTVRGRIGHGKNIGWVVYEHTPELATQWSLFTGGYCSVFFHKISTADERGGI